MSDLSDPAHVLDDGEVRSFFLRILDSGMPSEAKYEKFVQFFRRRSEVRNGIMAQCEGETAADTGAEDGVKRVALRVGKALGTWDAEGVRSRIAEGIRRALCRLRASQHRDGGWGSEVERSDTWATCYSVMCLDRALRMQSAGDLLGPDLSRELDRAAGRGLAWLEAGVDQWRADNLGDHGVRPVYTVWIVKSALDGREVTLRAETNAALRRSIARVAAGQNEDGGWDASLWGDRVEAHVWSEVGGTSSAIRVLAADDPRAHRKKILDGLEWLARTQNPDGSWNLESCRPELRGFQVTGPPVINKTCDAICGLLLASKLTPGGERSYEPRIASAVEWLRRQEKLLLDEQNQIQGWVWGSDPGHPSVEYGAVDYENTAMTLETLVQLPDSPLPLLTANAEWLLQTQYRKDGDPEDGMWKRGHTARIALALVALHERIGSYCTAPFQTSRRRGEPSAGDGEDLNAGA